MLKFNGIQLHYGFIIPHSSAISGVSSTNPIGLEFIHGNLHTSLDEWRVFNNYWVSGIKARYFNLQFPDVLGSILDFSLFAGPLVTHGLRHQFIISGGAGLSYHSKIYNAEENPRNQFFSSRLSFPLYVEARFKYLLAGRTYLTISGSYNHISNGGIRQPNYGMNYPTLALGLEHFNYKVPVLENNYRSLNIDRDRNLSFIFQALASYRVLDSTANQPEKGFVAYGFHLRASQPLGKIYSINAGTEFIIDPMIREQVRRENEHIDHKRFALTLGQDFTFGRFLFEQHLGFYLYSPYKARNSIYQKYELAYKAKGRLMYGVFLKAHLYIAELIGVNISYEFIR